MYTACKAVTTVVLHVYSRALIKECQGSGSCL